MSIALSLPILMSLTLRRYSFRYFYSFSSSVSPFHISNTPKGTGLRRAGPTSDSDRTAAGPTASGQTRAGAPRSGPTEAQLWRPARPSDDLDWGRRRRRRRGGGPDLDHTVRPAPHSLHVGRWWWRRRGGPRKRRDPPAGRVTPPRRPQLPEPRRRRRRRRWRPRRWGWRRRRRRWNPLGAPLPAEPPTTKCRAESRTSRLGRLERLARE